MCLVQYVHTMRNCTKLVEQLVTLTRMSGEWAWISSVCAQNALIASGALAALGNDALPSDIPATPTPLPESTRIIMAALFGDGSNDGEVLERSRKRMKATDQISSGSMDDPNKGVQLLSAEDVQQIMPGGEPTLVNEQCWD